MREGYLFTSFWWNQNVNKTLVCAMVVVLVVETLELGVLAGLHEAMIATCGLLPI